MTEKKQEAHKVLLRVPLDLYTGVVAEVAKESMKAGKVVSVNAWILGVIEKSVSKKGGKKK